MKRWLIAGAIVLGIFVVLLPFGIWAAHFTGSQDKTACYEMGKVTNQTVKYVGDGSYDGPQYGCFIKQPNGTWKQS